MRRSLLLGTCLTILILTRSGPRPHRSSSESAISSFPLAGGSFGDTFSLADSSQAGSHSWTTAAISRPAPWPTSPTVSPAPLTRVFGCSWGGQRGGRVPWASPLDLPFHRPSDLALYEGKATSVEIRYGSPEDLPLLLRDWLTHPEHLRISGTLGLPVAPVTL